MLLLTLHRSDKLQTLILKSTGRFISAESNCGGRAPSERVNSSDQAGVFLLTGRDADARSAVFRMDVHTGEHVRFE